MNFKLVLALSLFGLLLGIASIAGWIPTGTELPIWCAIWIVSAIAIGMRAPGKYFLHGLLTGLIGGILAGLVQGILFDSYIAHNPKVTESFKALPPGMNPRLLVLVLSPLVALLYALVLGGLAALAGLMFKKKPAAPAAPMASPPV